MGFGKLYSRKGILYGVVASVLRKHPAFSARVERLRTAPWNWQSWRVPWYFWQKSSSSDVGGIEPVMLCHTCALLIWNQVASNEKSQKHGGSWPRKWLHLVPTYGWPLGKVHGNCITGPGSLQWSLLQLPRICTDQCCLASWVGWLALEWRYLLSNIDWNWQCFKWSIWYDVFYILPLIHVDSLSNSNSPTALWAHHVWERTLGGPAGSHS